MRFAMQCLRECVCGCGRERMRQANSSSGELTPSDAFLRDPALYARRHFEHNATHVVLFSDILQHVKDELEARSLVLVRRGVGAHMLDFMLRPIQDHSFFHTQSFDGGTRVELYRHVDVPASMPPPSALAAYLPTVPLLAFGVSRLVRALEKAKSC